MMSPVFKWLCVYLILVAVNISNGIRFTNLVESKHKLAFGEQLALQRVDIRTEAVFESFLRKLLDALVRFPGKNLVRYCRVLHRHFNELEYKYTKDLATHMRYLSRMYRDDAKRHFVKYRNEIDHTTQLQIEFLETMNSLFTLQESILFDDYVFDVRDYGKETKINIDAETKKLLKVIVDSVLKLGKTERRALERKLKKVVKEYKNKQK